MSTQQLVATFVHLAQATKGFGVRRAPKVTLEFDDVDDVGRFMSDPYWLNSGAFNLAGPGVFDGKICGFRVVLKIKGALPMDDRLAALKYAITRIACAWKPPKTRDNNRPVTLTKIDSRELARAACVAVGWDFRFSSVYGSSWPASRCPDDADAQS